MASMRSYDPDKPVDPAEWKSLDEQERIYLVQEYHRKRRIKLPNPQLHATFHAIVENQIATGSEISTREVLLRLMEEGLSRHDAVHAIATVVSGVTFDTLKGKVSRDANRAYFERLSRLTAERWLKGSDEDGED